MNLMWLSLGTWIPFFIPMIAIANNQANTLWLFCNFDEAAGKKKCDDGVNQHLYANWFVTVPLSMFLVRILFDVLLLKLRPKFTFFKSIKYGIACLHIFDALILIVKMLIYILAIEQFEFSQDSAEDYKMRAKSELKDKVVKYIEAYDSTLLVLIFFISAAQSFVSFKISQFGCLLDEQYKWPPVRALALSAILSALYYAANTLIWDYALKNASKE